MEEINYDAEGNPMLTWEQAEIKSSSYVKLETDVETIATKPLMKHSAKSN